MAAIFRSFAVLCVLIFLPLPSIASERLTVFAAASLKDALDEAALAWGGDIVISYGGSGLIARQVAQGAPADIVILANLAWMDWLKAQMGDGAPDDDILVSNRLVVVGPAGAPPLEGFEIIARLGSGRLAMGNTRGVPAGIYGRQWLEAAGLWPALQDRLAETENVRAALALVAREEAPLGVVYASDAWAEPRVTVVMSVPDNAHAPILYPMARLSAAPQGLGFAGFLLSDAGQAIFVAHGFSKREDRP